MIAEALRRAAPLAAAALALLAAGCGGGGGSGNAGSNACVPNCNAPSNLLVEDDVRKVIAQAVGEAQARGAKATIAVVDRVGNVLAVYHSNSYQAATVRWQVNDDHFGSGCCR